MPDWPANVVQQLLVGFLKKANDSADDRNDKFYREVWQGAPLKNYSDIINMWKEGPDQFLDLLYYYAKNTNTKAEIIVENIIKNTIKIFHDLECMLSLRNIPHLFGQGVFPFYSRHQLGYNRGLEKIYAPPDEQLLFYFLKYEKYFNKEKFIDWPGLLITSKNKDRDALTKDSISEMDIHPNEKGHRIMANYYYKKTEELYPYLLQEGK